MSRRASSSKPGALRRIVKTVTHEIIEEIVPSYPPPLTSQRRIAPTETTVQAIAKGDPYTTPNSLSNTNRPIPAVKRTILKTTTVNKAPLVGRNSFTTIPSNPTSSRETLVDKTLVNRAPIQFPHENSYATKPRHPRNHPKKVPPTNKYTKSIFRANTTPEPPQTTHAPTTRKQLRSRINLVYKSSKCQPNHSEITPANRSLQSAIAKQQPSTNPKRRKSSNLVSRSSQYRLSPSANLAPALAPALYKSLPPAVPSYSDSPSDAHSHSASTASRSVYTNFRNEKQRERMSPRPTLSGATIKTESMNAIKQESIFARLSPIGPEHVRMRKMKQTPRNSSATNYLNLSVKQEPEKEIKSENIIEPSLQTSTLRKLKQTARKSSRTNSPPTADTTLRTRVHNRTGSASTSREASSRRTTGIWVVTHETGYYSGGLHSDRPPVVHEVGTYMTRAAAISKGKQTVGDDVGYSWQEVRDAGGLRVISDTQDKWEIRWSPPDSRYSLVTARFIPEGGGVWAVDAETGLMPDRSHSYEEPTKKRLGLYLTRELALEEGKKQMGRASGWDWEKVSRNRYFEIREDCAERWEGFWGPPGSEFMRIVVKRIGMPTGGVSEMR